MIEQKKAHYQCRVRFRFATGVPIPAEDVTKRRKTINFREIKVGLFDFGKNAFFGNSVSIPCSWNEKEEDRWNPDPKFKDYQNLIVRLSRLNQWRKRDRQIMLIFELVIGIVSGDGKLLEMVSGWSQLSFQDMF